jgi:hypothetical protein
MGCKDLKLVILIIAVLLLSVESATPEPSHAYCSGTGNLQFKADEIQQGEQASFEYSSYFMDSTTK